MTLPRLLALVAYWEHSPPVHEAFASFVGIGKPGSGPTGGTASGDERADDSDALMKDLMAAGFALPPGFPGV